MPQREAGYRLLALFVGSIVALVAAGCSGGAKAPTSTATATIAGNSGPVIPAASSGATAAPRPSVVIATPRPGASPAPTTSGTQLIAPPGDDPCSPFKLGPEGPGAAGPTPSAALVAGGSPNPASPQPARPPVDLNTFTVPDSALPAGYVRFGDDRIGLTNLIGGTKDPQASANFLNAIGFLAGRQQNWSGPVTQLRYPVVFVQDLVFSTDSGASRFLRQPVFGAALCIRAEQGSALGQESASFYYQYMAPLTNGSSGAFDGHSDLVRCGRVVIAVTEAGPPGMFAKRDADTLASRALDEAKKSNPCS